MPPPLDGQLVSAFPVADLCPAEVLRGGEHPALLGSRCPACGELALPSRTVCNRCLSSPQEEVSLGDRGKLYAFSAVHVSSSRPVPYTLGFVDLPCGVRVLTRVFGPASELNIDDEVVVTAGDGDDWGFRKAK